MEKPQDAEQTTDQDKPPLLQTRSCQDAASEQIPAQLGRYRVVRLLGEGGFGRVFLGHDDSLKRPVAIKVPLRRRVARPQDMQAYLAEARILATLDHPHIVPVYDVGNTEDGLCYVVSKFIEGQDLAGLLRTNRPGYRESAELIATLAEALHYAHSKGLVHRDVKPANLLVDIAGKPFVVDFGLALKEEDFGVGATHVGTPAYMSPEQARGEGHRVDGRTDIFSLGVVFYDLLTGRRPFQGDSQSELWAQIIAVEAPPPRQLDGGIPKELERIVLKALAKRASERYSSAKEMADDLRHFMEGVAGSESRVEGEQKVRQPEPSQAQPLDRSKVAFISHASPDKEKAERLCQLLENQGIACWIAPRDIAPGANYGESIIRALENTPTTLLLLSAHANASGFVAKEVERATSKGKRVIPVLLENVRPAPALELHISSAQWVEAWRTSLDQVAVQLTAAFRIKPAAAGSDSQPIKIVPKGLRSFDAHDADFFLELLPGPRDREGLPDSIRFWKTRIEEKDAEASFAVGLICGPSGCGKSSLVKAGLLPRLGPDVVAIYIEATADQTETRLLNALRRRLPALPATLGLKETLAALRRGVGLSAGKKVLLVLDQFEQWLHAKKAAENTELVEALRQGDGARAQCIVMVRDDFWMGAIRFMRELEIRLVEGQNSAAVDLFPIHHAERVLAAFGRAFGVLPGDGKELDKEQKQFVEDAVRGLAQEGKVICVRLALFAEMMKGKPWTPASLREAGQVEGVGATFLEETFSSSSAPPEHRYHQKAARAVLNALLPEAGTDIKGHMRSGADLLSASGYANRPREFADLLRILNSEVRLITPTDPEGEHDPRSDKRPRLSSADQSAGGAPQLTSEAACGYESSDAVPQLTSEAACAYEDASAVPKLASAAAFGHDRYYQLTHDYLVHSLRDWLTRKQKETRRGRAELLLADRASVWNARQENRQLPSLTQFVSIRFWTRKKDWTPPQKKMMRRAGRYHAARAASVAMILLAMCLAGYEAYGRIWARALRKQLLSADTHEISKAIAGLESFRHWAKPLLEEARRAAETDHDEARKLRASLALLPVDPGQSDYLVEQLLAAPPDQLAVIRDLMKEHVPELPARLQQVVEDPAADSDQRFRAACALAAWDTARAADCWHFAAPLVADKFLEAVQKNPSHFAPLLELLRPVSGYLLPPLEAVSRDGSKTDSERSFATNILVDYAGNNPAVLASLLMDADRRQFALLYPKLAENGQAGMTPLAAALGVNLPAAAQDAAKEALGKRQANAAVALLKMGRGDQVWPLLKSAVDPRARSYFIEHLSPLGADPQTIVTQLAREREVSIRRALLICLGEFDVNLFPQSERDRLLSQMLDFYRTDTDAGIHGAIFCLLAGENKWGQRKTLFEIDRQLARQYMVNQLASALGLDGRGPNPFRVGKSGAPPRWYVNGQGQTMVVIPGPVEFDMGSPTSEADREGGPEGKWELLHPRKIERSFAIAAREVTVEQFKQVFGDNYQYGPEYAKTPDSPINSVTWYEAAEYCNRLSEREGLPKDQWCYLKNSAGKYERGMKPATNFLQRVGYRLPTEAEWEYACRGGTATSRYYGETESKEMLGRYAVYVENSKNKRLLPVGSLLPNEFGLFDMLGNALEWCHDQPRQSKWAKGDKAIIDIGDSSTLDNEQNRVLRGGSFVGQASNVRSAYRIRNRPTNDNFVVGFRVARTFAP